MSTYHIARSCIKKYLTSFGLCLEKREIEDCDDIYGELTIFFKKIDRSSSNKIDQLFDENNRIKYSYLRYHIYQNKHQTTLNIKVIKTCKNYVGLKTELTKILLVYLLATYSKYIDVFSISPLQDSETISSFEDSSLSFFFKELGFGDQLEIDRKTLQPTLKKYLKKANHLLSIN